MRHEADHRSDRATVDAEVAPQHDRLTGVTPIIQPDVMTREEVLAGVLKNYRRFYFKKAFGGYLWDKDPFRRKYLRGCLRAFVKSSMERKFYDLGRINYWGQDTVDWGFDESKVYSKEELVHMSQPQQLQRIHGRRKRLPQAEILDAGAALTGTTATAVADDPSAPTHDPRADIRAC